MDLCNRRVGVKLHLPAALQELCDGLRERLDPPPEGPLSPGLFHRPDGQGAQGGHKAGACKSAHH